MIFDCFLKIVTNSTVQIVCVPGFTYYDTDTGVKGYYDAIICKWELNGLDYYDMASTDCGTIGYGYLSSTGNLLV